jgi:Flp pilus assembly protein TadD
LASADESAGDTAKRSALIHRETLQLGALIVLAIASFMLTRAVAASNREMSIHDAGEWFRRGRQAMDAGRVDEAIDDLRRATVRDRQDKRYVLALAQALALQRDDDGARSVLLTLRESEPEDPEINLQLGRLAAARQDVTEALRFYHNALYAPWPAEQADARRRVRLELIRFLLTNGQGGRALSELLAVSTDLPDDSALRLEVAQLFARAGDNSHALEQFQRILRSTPQDGEALAGAGQAAFRLGDYPAAVRYLRSAPADDAAVRDMLNVVDLVVSNDPLATRIGSAERRRRLLADFSYAQQRLGKCVEQPSGSAPLDQALALLEEARTFENQVTATAILEQDTIEMGVDLVDRIEAEIGRHCGPLAPLDQALALIGRRHAAETR